MKTNKADATAVMKELERKCDSIWNKLIKIKKKCDELEKKWSKEKKMFDDLRTQWFEASEKLQGMENGTNKTLT